ncbi:hypothetical protein, partial [Sphaerotilus sp.]|uniref:hypothetical protein n=1 Tax=Sphaerotilus sp. TaxID=2093942 RepID=UPI0034E27907
LEPPISAWLFLGLSMASFNSPDGILWQQPLPWLLLGTAAGLWRAQGWARTLAMVVLVLLLAAMAWPGGADFPSVRVLLLDPWTASGLERRTGLHPTVGGALVASALLLWLMSPPVRRAFAQSDLDAVRASLPPLSDGQVKDDH